MKYFTNSSVNMNTIFSSIKRFLRFVMSSRGIMMMACVLIIAGYILMSGPGSTEQSFNPDIFSPRRIVVAPILCLSGYLLIVVGILRKSNKVC